MMWIIIFNSFMVKRFLWYVTYIHVIHMLCLIITLKMYVSYCRAMEQFTHIAQHYNQAVYPVASNILYRAVTVKYLCIYTDYLTVVSGGSNNHIHVVNAKRSTLETTWIDNRIFYQNFSWIKCTVLHRELSKQRSVPIW